MQDEKEMVREEENETPEAPDQEEALKQSEADTETEQEEAAEADKKPRKEKKLFKKDRTAELEAKIAELEQALADQKNAYYKAYADTENLKKRLHAEAETTRKYRIQSFALGLGSRGLSGTVIAFDFQADALRRIFGNRVDVRALSFEKTRRLLEI